MVAVIACLLAATPATVKAQCPGGVCPNQGVIYSQPLPVYRAPVREAINRASRAVYEFVTPEGYVYQGYIVRPLRPVTREQALRNATYWQQQAAMLEGK